MIREFRLLSGERVILCRQWETAACRELLPMENSPPRKPGFARQLLGYLRADGEAAPDEREHEQQLRTTLISYSALSLQFVLILTLSSAIASFGLMADSPVTIVGAMLIAPLMKPILAYAYAIITADRRLLWRAVATLLTGVLLTMLVAGLTEKAVGLSGPTEQIISRTRPTLIDLGVTVAAGIAAALASVRRNVADTLPGVAIAVALVPPLCVAGIGFSLGDWTVAWGAAMLFAVNLVAIVLAAANVLILEGYSRLRRGSHGLLLLFLLAACGLTVPLSAALSRLRADDLAQETVENYLHEVYDRGHIVHPADLSSLDARWSQDHIFIFAEIKSPKSEFTTDDCRELQTRLQQAFGIPVNLKVQLLLTREILIYPHLNPDGSRPDYGENDLVPRR